VKKSLKKKNKKKIKKNEKEESFSRTFLTDGQNMLVLLVFACRLL
jgi:hypothetical protein